MSSSKTVKDIALILPIIDIDVVRKSTSPSTERFQESKRLTDALKTYGAVLVKCATVSEQDNAAFLNLMEEYFALPDEEKMKDARPQYAYQVGATPSFAETPSCLAKPSCIEVIDRLPLSEKPTMWSGPDPKWRYFWPHNGNIQESKHPELNMPRVIPETFKEVWAPTMDKWAKLMHDTVVEVCRMVGVGLGLEDPDVLVKLSEGGRHLLAPTGSDLAKYGQMGMVLAGFHYDLNLLSIHGQSRYPGLNIWARNTGSKIPVKVPDGCLLVQAGKQLEILTGGEILAGYHEVVVSNETLMAIEKAKLESRKLWRVSSTLFFHVHTDRTLSPLPPFDTEERKEKYVSQICGDFVRSELQSIKLMR